MVGSWGWDGELRLVDQPLWMVMAGRWRCGCFDVAGSDMLRVNDRSHNRMHTRRSTKARLRYGHVRDVWERESA